MNKYVILKGESGWLKFENANDLKTINWSLNNGCVIVGTVESELTIFELTNGFEGRLMQSLNNVNEKLSKIYDIL